MPVAAQHPRLLAIDLDIHQDARATTRGMRSGMPEANKHEPQLKRSLGFVLITLYGLGTTVGAGI